MGKRFKGKPCAYCDGTCVTADHVFARNFFPIEDRAHLPQVSACEPCNRDKSQLEHYLLSVLSFGGNHPASSAILAGEVPRRLEKNRKLHTELANGTREVLLRTGDGTREPHAAIRFRQAFTAVRICRQGSRPASLAGSRA